MKFPVLWLVSVSLSAWVGTEKGVRLAWDLVSRSRITLHFGAKAVNQAMNGSFPSSPQALFQDESKCEVFVTNISFH